MPPSPTGWTHHSVRFQGTCVKVGPSHSPLPRRKTLLSGHLLNVPSDIRMFPQRSLSRILSEFVLPWDPFPPLPWSTLPSMESIPSSPRVPSLSPPGSHHSLPWVRPSLGSRNCLCRGPAPSLPWSRPSPPASRPLSPLVLSLPSRCPVPLPPRVPSPSSSGPVPLRRISVTSTTPSPESRTINLRPRD